MIYILKGVQSERLFFRLVEETDFDTWLDFFSEPEAARFVGLDDINGPYEQCRKWFEKCFDRYKNNLGGMNALIDKNTGRFIGQAGLLIQNVDGIDELEVAYSILPKYWNLGYATEAAIKCKEVALEKKYADSLISIIHVENIKSEKVALKNRMKWEKKTEFRGMPVNVFRIRIK